MRGKFPIWLVFGLGLLIVIAAVVAHAQFFSTKNSVKAIVLQNGGGLYIGTFGNGIYYSPDRGVHWEKMSEGLGDQFIMTLAVGTGKEVFAGTVRKGVFRIMDGGDHWEAINTGLGNVEVPVLLVKGNTLYAGTGQGVFRSTSRGDQWGAYNSGMEQILVRSLVVDARHVLLAGTAGKGLYQYDSNRSVWRQITRGFEGGQRILDNYIRTLTLGPDGTLYAGTFDGGVYISRDHGEQWRAWSEGLTNLSIRSLVIGRDKTVYVGTGKGIFARTRSDHQWRWISKGLEDDIVQAMVIDESGKIYAGTTQGLYKGSISGEWIPITPRFSKI